MGNVKKASRNYPSDFYVDLILSMVIVEGHSYSYHIYHVRNGYNNESETRSY